MTTVSSDPYPNLTRLELAVRACFDGSTFDEERLQDHLKQCRMKMNPVDGCFRKGVEVLESDDEEKIKTWLMSLETILS